MQTMLISPQVLLCKLCSYLHKFCCANYAHISTSFVGQTMLISPQVLLCKLCLYLHKFCWANYAYISTSFVGIIFVDTKAYFFDTFCKFDFAKGAFVYLSSRMYKMKFRVTEIMERPEFSLIRCL